MAISLPVTKACDIATGHDCPGSYRCGNQTGRRSCALPEPTGTVAFMLTALLGWIIAAASSLTLLPILLRVLRTRDTAGVSATTAALASLAMLCWTGYTWSLRDWPAFASSVGPLAIWSTLLAALVVLRCDRRTSSIAAAAATAAVLLALFAPASLFAVLAVAGSIGWALPQLRTAFSSVPLSGVSVHGYALVCAENIGWIVYGFATGHLAYIYAPAVQAPATALIAYRTHRSRRQRPALVLDDPTPFGR